MSIEPRVYRDALGRAILLLRPHLEVAVVEPAGLEAALARVAPQVVICGLPEPTALAQSWVGWVEFCPYEKPTAKIHLGARRWELSEVDLEELLSIVDEAEGIVRRAGGQGRPNTHP